LYLLWEDLFHLKNNELKLEQGIGRKGTLGSMEERGNLRFAKISVYLLKSSIINQDLMVEGKKSRRFLRGRESGRRFYLGQDKNGKQREGERRDAPKEEGDLS